MCGRFTLFSSGESLIRTFGVAGLPDHLIARYNIAPTQAVTVVRVNPERRERESALLRWGLVPFWATDPGIGNRLINARAETAAERPAFRAAFRHRRCLVPVDGFYEWRRRRGGSKQPFFVRMRDGNPFGLAGLWERWEGGDGGVLESCTVLTTDGNAVVAPIHDRMPVIIPPESYDLWLDPSVRKPDLLQPLLRPYPAAEMVAYPIDERVNNPRIDDESLIHPAA
jgi:putative SOS response-associated peptidase YedK